MKDYIYSRQCNASEVMYINSLYNTNYDTVNINSKMTIKDNIGEAEAKGIEIEIKQDISKHLFLNSNFTLTKTKVISNIGNPASIGKELPYIPKKMFNLSLDYIKDKYTVNLSYNYKDEVFSTDTNSDTVHGVFGSYDKIEMLNSRVTYQVNKFIQIIAICDNILDKKYYYYYKGSDGRTYGIYINSKF